MTRTCTNRSTRPLFRGEEPGDEARMLVSIVYECAYLCKMLLSNQLKVEVMMECGSGYVTIMYIYDSYIPQTEQHESEGRMLFCLGNVTNLLHVTPSNLMPHPLPSLPIPVHVI